ncbi:hypothetical protein TKK_0011077 [Trichogramma kaykai]
MRPRLVLTRSIPCPWDSADGKVLFPQNDNIKLLPAKGRLLLESQKHSGEIFNGLLPFGRFVKVSPAAPDSLAALAVLLGASKYQVCFSVLQ